MKRIIVTFAVLALGACATPCRETAPGPTTITYACENGAVLGVSFDRAGGRVIVQEDSGSPFVLPVQVSGSGFRYAGQGVELRGRGETAQWTTPSGEQVSCRETTARRTAALAGGAASCPAVDS